MHTSHGNPRGFRRPLAFVMLAAAAMTISHVDRAAADESTEDALIIDSVVLQPMVEAEIPARHTGVLARIHVAEGAAVAKDAVLATLDPRAAKLAVQKAETEREQAVAKAGNTVSIEYAEKALDVARAELRRSTESVEKFAKSVSQSQIDVERLTVEKLELERRQAEHEQAILRFEQRLKENALETARLELDLHVARAPFAGVVSLVRGRPGEWVQPGTVILRLIAIDSLRAEGFAPAAALSSLKVGATLRFNLEGESDASAAEATLQYISPEVDPVTRQVRVWCRIDNSTRQLRPGQQGRLRMAPAAESRAGKAPPIARQAEWP